MDKVQDYYSTRVSASDDLLFQVGKTVNGEPVGEESVKLILENIKLHLGLNNNDNLMDVGCGNGLLSNKFADIVCQVVGVEKNPDLLEVANKNNNKSNLRYVMADIFEIESIGIKVNKIIMYEVLQHIPYHGLKDFFYIIKNILPSDGMLFLGGVLDEEKKWEFYDTKERRCSLIQELVKKDEPMGFWYHKDYIECLSNDIGMKAEFFHQHSMLYTSHYRFDCLLRFL